MTEKLVWIRDDTASLKVRLLDSRSQKVAKVDELNRQTCQHRGGAFEKAAVEGGHVPPAMADLLEPVVGLVSMSRICAYFLRQQNPNLDELRQVIGLMLTSSEAVLAMIQGDARDRRP